MLVIFIFRFACDWRVNVTGIFLCFSLLTVIFTQLFLCFTFPTWMSTLICQSQKLSTYTVCTKKRLIFSMYMWIIFEIGILKYTSM